MHQKYGLLIPRLHAGRSSAIHAVEENVEKEVVESDRGRSPGRMPRLWVVVNSSHERPCAWGLSAEGGVGEVETRVLLLKPLQHQLLVYFLLREHVQLSVPLECRTPSLGLPNFPKHDVQLSILDHPERAIPVRYAERVFVEKGRIALYAHFQMMRL